MHQYFILIDYSYNLNNEGENSVWIEGSGHLMWDSFSIRIIPNRAVFRSDDPPFNVSVKGEYWAPYAFGEEPFYFKIYSKRMNKGPFEFDESPVLLAEKTFVSNKSKNEYHWQIGFNFTIFPNMMKRGAHLIRVVGGGPAVSFTGWGCSAVFAINIK